MTYWLRCRVVPGQFPSEYVVSAQQVDGRTFSLFAPKDLVQVDREPSFENPVTGLLQVDVWSRKQNQLVVQLPHQSPELGRFVLVGEDQLVSKETVSAS